MCPKPVINSLGVNAYSVYIYGLEIMSGPKFWTFSVSCSCDLRRTAHMHPAEGKAMKPGLRKNTSRQLILPFFFYVPVM